MASYSVTATKNATTAWQAFDKSLSTSWANASSGGNVSFMFNSPTIVKGFRFVPSVNAASFPTKIVIHGKNLSGDEAVIKTFTTSIPVAGVPQDCILESAVKYDGYSFILQTPYGNSGNPEVADIEFLVYRNSLIPSPTLQEKTVTPIKSSQSVTPDSNYDGLSRVMVEAIPNIYTDTSDATATPSDIFEGKTAYVNGEKITGVASISVGANYDWWSPRMLSNTTFQGSSDANYVTDASINDTKAWNAFDKDSTTTWTAAISNSELRFDFGETVLIKGVRFYPSLSKPNALPKTIQLYGSIPGGSKVLIRTLTTSTPEREVSQDFVFEEPVEYQKYTFVMGTAHSGSDRTINDIEFLIDVASVGSMPKLQEKTVTPTRATQTITPDENYDGLSKVVVDGISDDEYPDISDATITEKDVALGKIAYGSSGRIVGTMSSVSLQEKTVTPTTSSQSVTPDSSYDGLSKVIVNAVPSSFLDMSDKLVTLTIKSGPKLTQNHQIDYFDANTNNIGAVTLSVGGSITIKTYLNMPILLTTSTNSSGVVDAIPNAKIVSSNPINAPLRVMDAYWGGMMSLDAITVEGKYFETKHSNITGLYMYSRAGTMSIELGANL